MCYCRITVLVLWNISSPFPTLIISGGNVLMTFLVILLCKCTVFEVALAKVFKKKLNIFMTKPKCLSDTNGSCILQAEILDLSH